jgi:hypothetical protein
VAASRKCFKIRTAEESAQSCMTQRNKKTAVSLRGWGSKKSWTVGKSQSRSASNVSRMTFECDASTSQQLRCCLSPVLLIVIFHCLAFMRICLTVFASSMTEERSCTTNLACGTALAIISVVDPTPPPRSTMSEALGSLPHSNP